MKFACDTRSTSPNEHTAELLFQALPWIKSLTGKTIVIKYGGSAMEDHELRRDVMSDIVLLKLIGARVLIVHGGGKDINEALRARGFSPQFLEGQRVTEDAAMDVVREVLVGKVNQELVAAVNAHGNLAVGVSGADAGTLIAECLDTLHGLTGRVVGVNIAYLERLIAADYIPVLATVATGADGAFYNVNADSAAGFVAAAIGAHKLIFLTDVDGLYANFPDQASLISNITADEVSEIVNSGAVATGMLPKIKSCLAALEGGVLRSHIINGTTPHALLLELLTNAGIGTVIHATTLAYEQDACPLPLEGIAARLTENLT